MAEEWFKSCLPKEYYEQFLREGVYPDGRSISAFNPLFFKLGAWGGVGSALIKQGGVAVSCTVQASLGLCHDGPLITSEVDACASVSQAEINDVTDMLNQLFSNEAVAPRSALLAKGVDTEMSMTWELILQVQILNADGPISDAVVCAASAALYDVRLPAVRVTHALEDESPIQREEISILEVKSPLVLGATPVAVTFHVFQGAKQEMLLVDAPQDVVEYCSSKASMVTDGKNVLMMRTRGPLSNEHLLSSMMTLAERRHRSIMDTLRQGNAP